MKDIKNSQNLLQADYYPSSSTISELNRIRNRFGIPSVSYSDIFSVQSNSKDFAGNFILLAQRALQVIGSSYEQNNSLNWSSSLTKDDISQIPIWRDVQDKGNSQTRSEFAKSYNLVDIGTYGTTANAEYSDDSTISGIRGGLDNFPIYPADMRYMANGKKNSGQSNKPGNGFDQALSDIKSAFNDKSIYFDYLNALSYTLFKDGAIVDKKNIPGSYFTGTLLQKFTSDDYQRYLRFVDANSSVEIKNAAIWYYGLESSTVSYLSKKTLTSINILRQSSKISALIADIYNGKIKFSPDKFYDSKVLPYVLARLRLSLASSANSLLKNSSAALQIVIDCLSNEKSQVAFLEHNSEIKELFIVLAGSGYLGKENNISLDANKIDAVVDKAISGGLITFTDKSLPGKLKQSIKTLNTCGLLGTIGFIFNVTRSIYDTLNLVDLIKNGKLTDSQVISLVSRYFSVYGGLGNLKLFISTLNPVCRKAMLSAATCLRADQVSPKIWGISGSVASNIHIDQSIELQTLDSATAVISKNFSEISFNEEGRNLENTFTSNLNIAVQKMPAGSATNIKSITSSSVEQFATEIETITAKAIAKDEAGIAIKCFGISFAVAGLLSDALSVASSIVDLAETKNPTSQQILDLSSSLLGLSGSLIGFGVAYGFLEAALFPPLTISLAIGSTIIGLINIIISQVNARTDMLKVRDQITKEFRDFEKKGYLHDWGDEIQFLSVYFDTTRDRSDGTDKITRWSPPNVSIFVDENAAWQAFQQAIGSTSQKFAIASKKLVHAKYNP